MKNIDIINNYATKSPWGGFRGLLTWLRKATLWGVGGLLLVAGCKEEGRIDHIDGKAPAPAQVTEVAVRNTPGGAVLTYQLPEDKNLLCVRAEYEIQPGVIREIKSSYYKDSLVLEGFGDTREYGVNVYSVGKNGKSSEPLIVKIKPLTPPVKVATKVLKETFGGVSVTVENPHNANLAVVLMSDTANIGYQVVLLTYYTTASKATFRYRGLDTIPGLYSVYLRDRWSNLSDTVSAILTPVFEEYIPKNTWAEVHLPTDTWQPIEDNPNYSLSKAWDERIDHQDIMFATKTDAPIPQWATWDMGITIILNRFKIWHRGPGERAWNTRNVKKFELYGSMSPNPDGSWDDTWIPLGKFEAVKPSPGETITTEDHYYGNVEGIDFDVEESEFAPNPFVPVRYIRFKTTETFYGPTIVGGIFLMEISFWGQVLK